MRNSLVLFSFFIFFGDQCAAQAVGFWRDHLPYGQTIDLTEGDGVVYCATPYAVFSYNNFDNSLERISKANGLTDTGISAISYDSVNSVLIVGYQNGNLDFVFEGTTINLPDIRRSDILGDKTINEIVLREEKAYLACGFGIVVIDVERLEVSDTYLIGPAGTFIQTNDIAFDDTSFFVATEEGIYTAPITHPFLANFGTWSVLEDFPDPFAFIKKVEINSAYFMAIASNSGSDDLYYKPFQEGSVWTPWTNFQDANLREIYMTEEQVFVSTFDVFRVYDLNLTSLAVWGDLGGVVTKSDAILKDAQGTIWVTTVEGGVVGYDKWGNQFQALPDGPTYSNLRRLDAYNDNLFVASGGADGAWVSNWDALGTYGFVGEKWFNARELDGVSFFDIMDVSINPVDNSEVFVGSWVHGLVQIKDGEIIERYDENNSSLSVANFGGIDRIGVGGVDFDPQGNLWFTNAHTETPIHVRTAGGEFQAFKFIPELDEEDIITEIVASRQGYVYAILPRGGGVLVLNHNGTILDTSDDVYNILTIEEGDGGLPVDEVISLEEDLDGEIWIGTLQGPAVIYNPEAIFEGENFDAQQILIEQGGNIQILLETETVSCIEIDGANRKWIGTVNSGVFLMSADGTQQIQHFTKDNSPLLANNVIDIAINHSTGEVFFGTEQGIMGYRSDATNFVEEIDEVVVYPNPVRPDYSGVITFDGLSRDADIKVTDISGNVVFQTVANGGRATWDGRDFSGNRASTGVYLVYVTNPSGNSTGVGKVVFIN